MQWEVRFLFDEHLLGRTMFVMLPVATSIRRPVSAGRAHVQKRATSGSSGRRIGIAADSSDWARTVR